MKFTINHRWGDSVDGEAFSLEYLQEVLSSLDATGDGEHGDVSIWDNRGGCGISFFAGDRGLVAIENDEASFHMTGVGRQAALLLAYKFVTEGYDSVYQDSWIRGYG